MKFYNDRLEILERDFRRLRIGSSHEIKKRVQSILKNLNIPKAKWKNFSSKLSIYELLLQLAREGHPQVTYILDLIDEKGKWSKLSFAIGGGILLSWLAYLLSQPAFQFVIDGIKNLFSYVITIPAIGLVFNVGMSIYYFWDVYNNRRITEFSRWRDNFFLFFSSSANITAYIILLVTAATASPVVGGLFVAAATVDVLREAFCLVQEYFQHITSPPIDENDHLNVHRDYARRVFGFEKRRNALGINLVAALLLVAITALWCFLPGGIPATIVAFAAMGIVYLTKHALVKWNEDRLRERLQTQLEELENSYNPPNEELCADFQLDSNSLQAKENYDNRADLSLASHPKSASSQRSHKSIPSAESFPFFRSRSSRSKAHEMPPETSYSQDHSLDSTESNFAC